MADTPRVTVPVEPTREMWAAGANAVVGYKQRHHDKVVEQVWTAMLSAAPAPEGGAVLANDLRCLKETFERIAARPPEEQPHYKSGVRPFGTGDLRHIIEVLTKAAALATREEAPAEAGERECGWCDGRKTKQTPSTDFTIPCPYCKGAGKEALRAQPQAREDAQPVAWLETNRTNGERRATVRQPSDTPTMRKRWTYTPLYTHPAPDALRVAVEALEQIATVDMGGGFLGALACRQVATKALAALQAEQKGGA